MKVHPKNQKISRHIHLWCIYRTCINLSFSLYPQSTLRSYQGQLDSHLLTLLTIYNIPNATPMHLPPAPSASLGGRWIVLKYHFWCCKWRVCLKEDCAGQPNHCMLANIHWECNLYGLACYSIPAVKNSATRFAHCEFQLCCLVPGVTERWLCILHMGLPACPRSTGHDICMIWHILSGAWHMHLNCSNQVALKGEIWC